MTLGQKAGWRGAVVLEDAANSLMSGRIVRLLDAFGHVSWRATAAEFEQALRTTDGSGVALRVFASAQAVLRLISNLEREAQLAAIWRRRIHSIFACGGHEFAGLPELVKALSSGTETRVCANSSQRFAVSDQLREFCGVMSGICCTASGRDPIQTWHMSSPRALNIINSEAGAVFARFEHKGVPVFVSGTQGVIDLDAELTGRGFDLRDHFLGAVPAVTFIKWAMADSGWRAPETSACLIIDDPLLKPTYGYVNYQMLLTLMKKHSFTTSIAFIPWNWARSHRDVVELFRQQPQFLSLSVHGCDHTREEFGSRDRPWLARQARLGLDRMRRHEALTGIEHDRVMVFPQGVFSAVAPGVLKQSGFLAIVNSEVLTTDPQPRPITIASCWDVAVMDYDCFPIFTRRYPTEGLENFAFDILLGKPCLLVIHHDYCWDRYAGLIAAITRLNTLPSPLKWRRLGESVRRSCRYRPLDGDVVEVEMYGSELELRNDSGRAKDFLVYKRESEPALIEGSFIDSRPLPFAHSGRGVEFNVRMEPGESRLIRIAYQPMAEAEQGSQSVPYRLKTTGRRYLCELRDNFVTKLKFSLRPPSSL
jgi:hypothetical protein